MDAIDQSVLSCLLADGRATYAGIGDVVGLSAPAVERRIDRLRETGAIRSSGRSSGCATSRTSTTRAASSCCRGCSTGPGR